MTATQKTIHKYPLPLSGTWKISTPPGHFKPLCVQLQYGAPVLWAEVEAGHNIGFADRIIHMVGTGHATPRPSFGAEYVGTVQLDHGHLVLHVYATPEIQ